jgi:non-homologous end joining protein Ku
MPRSLQSAILSMGMVNIPVKLYTAAKSKAVSFHWPDRDSGQRVHQQLYTERQPVSVTPLPEERPQKH